MLYFLTYLYITLLSALSVVSFISIMLLMSCGVLSVIRTILFFDDWKVQEKYKTYESFIKEDGIMKFAVKGLKLSLLGFILCTLVPNKEQLAIIVGLPTAYNIATSEEAQKIPDNVLNAVNSFLEESTEDKKESK